MDKRKKEAKPLKRKIAPIKKSMRREIIMKEEKTTMIERIIKIKMASLNNKKIGNSRNLITKKIAITIIQIRMEIETKRDLIVMITKKDKDKNS